ncbi:hypothetical protein BHE74_00034726 [Ensete ventricosum]|nr:hypothetical protein BHE74_00034726 [Ensete ventricosum]
MLASASDWGQGGNPVTVRRGKRLVETMGATLVDRAMLAEVNTQTSRMIKAGEADLLSRPGKEPGFYLAEVPGSAIGMSSRSFFLTPNRGSGRGEPVLCVRQSRGAKSAHT